SGSSIPIVRATANGGRSMPQAYVLGTFDTKGPDLRYVAELLRPHCTVTTVDVSTAESPSADAAADVLPNEVAAYHPEGAAAVFTADRGSAIPAMAAALRRFLGNREVDGVLGLGGS